MTDFAQPSRDPANDDSLLGMARQVLDKFLSEIDDQLPARVVSFNGDRQNPRVTVAPLVRLLTTDGQQLARAPLASLPVQTLGGGGVALSFFLKPGDLGWIKSNDRDISVFLQGCTGSAPNTLRKHSFSDAVFIPDVMRGMQVAEEDQEHAVLQTVDGTVRLAIWPDRLKITVGGVVAEFGPDQASVMASGKGLTATPAGSSFSGHVDFPDGVSIGGIEFGPHVHPIDGGTTGAAETP